MECLGQSSRSMEMKNESNGLNLGRIQSEAIFWDQEYGDHSVSRMSNNKNYEEYFLSSYPYFKYAFDFFGEISGKRILDLGCGTGWLSIYFSRSRANVYCCDPSANAIKIAQEMAKTNSVKVTADVMPAENLKYEDDFFDFIFGNSVLHHTDLPKARDEIYRCLRGNGKACFIEPLVYNPLLKLYRMYSKHAHSPEEHPLTYEDIHTLGEPFSELSFKEFEFLVLPANLRNILKHRLDKLENRILRLCSPLRKYCSTIAISVIK